MNDLKDTSDLPFSENENEDLCEKFEKVCIKKKSRKKFDYYLQFDSILLCRKPTT